MISQVSVGGALPGLALKAWAYVISNGTLIKGFNIASASRSGVGTYVLTYTTATTNAETITRFTIPNFTSSSYTGARSNSITTGMNVSTYTAGSTPADTAFFVEIYE